MANDVVHDRHMPNESTAYRTARDRLLAAERSLRQQVEAVAAMRRELPLGGEIKEDYVFRGQDGSVKLSALFGERDTLILYSFMYGPKAKAPCPMCTAFLDSLNGAAPHLMQKIALAIVAKSPLKRIETFAKSRGWTNFRLLSSAENTYNRDYFGESADGDQMPAMNVFVRRNGRIHHFWQSELFHLASEPGQDPRHLDVMWPLWNVLDVTPHGRGTDWYPRVNY